MKLFSHAGATKKTKMFKGFQFGTLLVVFKWHHGSEGVNAAAEVRKAQGNESKGMSDTCCQVPTEYIPNLHGRYMVLQGLYERLQNFQNWSKAGGDVSSPPSPPPPPPPPPPKHFQYGLRTYRQISRPSTSMPSICQYAKTHTTSAWCDINVTHSFVG